LSISSDFNSLCRIGDNLDGAIQNEDSNSSSACGSGTSHSTNKKLKLGKYKSIEIEENAQQQNTISCSTISEHDLNCPVQGCDSIGHLDGVSLRHTSYNTCPLYFYMNSDECKQKHARIKKHLSELALKLNRFNDSKKNLRNKQGPNEEQLVYFEKVKRDLKDIHHVESHGTGTDGEEEGVEAIINPEIYGDIKNLTTSFLLNTITTGIIPTPVHLLKRNSTSSTGQAHSNYSQTRLIRIQTPRQPSINDLQVSKYEFELFKESLILAESNRHKQTSPIKNESTNSFEIESSKLGLHNKSNKLIQFGNYEIETWYKSPYPDDFWQLDKIFLCQYCLKYMKSHAILNRHLEKCLWRHPPGREIYRNNFYSFFEVDGKFNKIYCQNLCLLAKLFLDHKTLYFDVEPFLFYVLTKYNQTSGSFEMIGYFSKEKQSIMNFNLSCILVLPPYMNKGYGKLLIDFSYLLSRVEEKLGSPERPLSDLGLISYRSYWKTKLLTHLAEHLSDPEISIKDMSLESGILSNDIISTFQYMGLVKYWKGKHVILKDVVSISSNRFLFFVLALVRF
jgi:hypothetical protein